jgi:molybdopterin converting factor small subunit
VKDSKAQHKNMCDRGVIYMRECGKITIVYMGYLAQLAGGREHILETCGTLRVKDVVKIEDLDLEDLIILVNGIAAKPDSTLKPGDKVVVLPHISGG